MFTNRRARKENAAAMYYKNKLYEQFLPRNGAVPELVNVESVNSETDVPVTTAIYVDFLRPDVYTETGTRKYPFKTLAAAYALAADSTGQKTIVLLSGNVNAENVTFSKGRVFLVGENSSGTHAPLIFTGSLTFTGQSASISDNRFSVSGLELIGVSGTTVITFSGSNPQRLFLKDVWITANGTSHGIDMTNNGSGSTLHTNDCKFSHNGSGDYHCINVAAGTANIDTSETSSTTLGAVGVANGICNITNSDIQSSGSYAIDVYAAGVLTLANCKITTTVADSHGIKLMNATSVAVVGNVSFSVPASATTGRAIYGSAGSILYYGPMFFLPILGVGASNAKISHAISRNAIDTTFTHPV
jgi:hypothetical protein